MKHAWMVFCAGVLFAMAAQAVPPTSSGKPVEINADTLEVQQEENIAIFTGNVIAVQGTTRLKSNVMTVYYTSKGDEATATAPESQGAVERIVVVGDVVLSTPEETATGREGVYEVAKDIVTLTGDVVLTKGQNVLKGDTLVYDFNTGKSVINSPFQSGGKPGGRVRALFVPGEGKNP